MAEIEKIERKLNERKEIAKQQESSLQILQSRAVHLANCYLIFQAVIINAICHKNFGLKRLGWWFIFTMSLLTSILNLIAVSLIGLKYLRGLAELDRNLLEMGILEADKSLLEQIMQVSPAVRVASSPERVKDPCQNVKGYMIFSFSIVLFVGFAALVLYGCFHFA